jgi:iron complex transport system ATP-binding protein
VATPILKVSGLSVHRGRTVILRDIHWQVQRRQHWAVLGANGSGKTSLLSALTGYLTPSGGAVQLFNQTYGESDWRELRKGVGLVSSSIRQLIHEDDTALEVVISGKDATIGFWHEPKPLDKRQGLSLLRQIECEEVADRSWSVLSQGERQRVLIGRALMAKPALLILDEPCAGLDPVARERFLSFVQRLASSRKSPTLILVTHHVEEIMPALSHVLMLKQGSVFCAGPKRNVMTSANFTHLFDQTIRVVRRAARYELQLTHRSRKVI